MKIKSAVVVTFVTLFLLWQGAYTRVKSDSLWGGGFDLQTGLAEMAGERADLALLEPVVVASGPVGQLAAAEAAAGGYEPLADMPQSVQRVSRRGVNAVADTCMVTSADDDGAGTLRECMGNLSEGDTVTFDPAVFPPNNPVTITLEVGPVSTVMTDSVTIDGSNAGVIIDGQNLSGGSGIAFFRANNGVVRGLQVVNFPDMGIVLHEATGVTVGGDRALGTGPLGQGNLVSGNEVMGIWLEDASENTILGNYVGTQIDGLTAYPNKSGVLVAFGSSDNVIGGETATTTNLISGNEERGIFLQDNISLDNLITGNLIGTDITGKLAVGNLEGIQVIDATNTIIGGVTAAERNIISGNRGVGVGVQFDTAGTEIIGNYIGVDIEGAASVPNVAGITIFAGAHETVVGGNTAGARNIISGNQIDGIQIVGIGTDDNRVEGNYIGTDVTGRNALPNGNGVTIFDGAQNNTVGGVEAGQRNVISGNNTVGVIVQGSGTNNNAVLGNYIGVDSTGTAALPNERGVSVDSDASFNSVGSSDSTNVIAGNDFIDVLVQGFFTSNNSIVGNYIGVDVTGTVAVGTTETGILIDEGANNNTIGGATAGARNVISGYSGTAVLIQILGSGNVIIGNYIGTNAAGTGMLGNQFGIGVANALNNVIGGDTAGERNVVGGSIHAAVQLQGFTSGNEVMGNYLGVDVTGSAVIPNEDGIVVIAGASQNMIGGETAAAGNVVSGNTDSGITIVGASTIENTVLNNLVGTDATGMVAIGNENGIRLLEGTQSNEIGSETAGNLISGNEPINDCCGYGIWLDDSGTSNNEIVGNLIGTNLNNSGPLPNSNHGILLEGGVTKNTIGTDNVIRFNGGSGLVVADSATINNRITRNQIYGNTGHEILFTPLQISIPALTHTASPPRLSGTVCANCEVEIYGSQDAEPSGELFLLSTTADGDGNFMVADSVLNDWERYAIIETNGNGFSKGFFGTAGAATITPTPTPSATNTPTATATPTASLTPTATSTGTAVPTPTGTLTVTPTATPGDSLTVTPTPTGTLDGTALPDSCAVGGASERGAVIAEDGCVYIPLVISGASD